MEILMFFITTILAAVTIVGSIVKAILGNCLNIGSKRKGDFND